MGSLCFLGGFFSLGKILVIGLVVFGLELVYSWFIVGLIKLGLSELECVGYWLVGVLSCAFFPLRKLWGS